MGLKKNFQMRKIRRLLNVPMDSRFIIVNPYFGETERLKFLILTEWIDKVAGPVNMTIVTRKLYTKT